MKMIYKKIYPNATLRFIYERDGNIHIYIPDEFYDNYEFQIMDNGILKIITK